ncbi:MAG TPA: serine/threonine-protein kinase, partial [Pirellulales bacterium]
AHPELGVLRQLPIALIAEEYRVRHRWGGKPDHGEYLSRFGDRAGEIAAALQQVEAELGDEAETADAAILPRTVPVRPLRRAPQYDERAPLDYRDFILQAHLGSGGIGKVYRARQRSLDRPVAVKMLKKQWLQFPAAVEQFLQEAKTVAGLRHPNLVGVHGLGRTPHGGYFIVMDLIDGRDLSEVMAAGPIRLADAVDWVAQAADALAYAHASGIIHCDLKPSNLLLDRNGKIFVTDFGFALPVEGVRDRRCIGGTLGYLAPEQLAGDVHGLSPATDVYGLGAVLYTLLSGCAPFDEPPCSSTPSRPCSASARIMPSASRGRIPPALEAIVTRCLTADSHQRFRSTAELATALRISIQETAHSVDRLVD